ncbi:sugar ABC transporter substrate-binding protein [Arthrobacter sp. H14-L1]|uniref:sugar ABC transporter substrate-binding protein n=1 Tax=Arthrobacter sp. H14-L1 TaxID=2996697 RepID=UPI0022707E95|nr:extracellular solute-binding protein [Arthrobacter sp. H14-L1]MCY0906269.1 extracellular solute-binding protein [Arthrobacter sp. H14-L1]
METSRATNKALSRRNLFQLGGIAAGALTLAGCSTTSPQTTSGTLQSSGKPSGQISILDDNTNMVFKNSTIKAFEQKTGIKVATYQQGNFNDLHDKMATMFAAQDSSFDVVMTWAGWSAEFGQAGWLEELTKSDVPTDLIQPALDAVSWRGKIYGLPKFVSVQTMFWNKDLYTKAGADPAAAPANWDEFVQTAKKLTSGDQFGYACDMGNPAGAYQNFLRMLLLSGGQMYDADYNPTFASDAGVEGLTKLVELLQVHKVMDPSSLQITNASDLADLFARGKTGSVFNWPFQFAVATASTSKLTKDTLGNGLIPGISVRSASIDGSEGFAINKYSKNKQAALAWLQFVTTGDVQMQIVEKEGWFPVSKTVLNDPAAIAALPVLTTYKESTKYVTKRYGTPWDNEFDLALSVQVINAMNGKTSPKDALTTAQKTAQDLVKKYLKS